MTGIICINALGETIKRYSVRNNAIDIGRIKAEVLGVVRVLIVQPHGTLDLAL